MLEEKYNKGWCSAGSVGFFCGASTRLPASDFLTPISWLLGSLAPWLRSSSLCEQETQRGIESRRAGD